MAFPCEKNKLLKHYQSTVIETLELNRGLLVATADVVMDRLRKNLVDVEFGKGLPFVKADFDKNVPQELSG